MVELKDFFKLVLNVLRQISKFVVAKGRASKWAYPVRKIMKTKKKHDDNIYHRQIYSTDVNNDEDGCPKKFTGMCD